MINSKQLATIQQSTTARKICSILGSITLFTIKCSYNGGEKHADKSIQITAHTCIARPGVRSK